VLEEKKLDEGRGREKGEEMEKRLRGIERKMEMREREEKKRNILIKGLVVLRPRWCYVQAPGFFIL